mgnify:CR=1 FL=1
MRPAGTGSAGCRKPRERCIIITRHTICGIIGRIFFTLSRRIYFLRDFYLPAEAGKYPCALFCFLMSKTRNKTAGVTSRSAAEADTTPPHRGAYSATHCFVLSHQITQNETVGVSSIATSSKKQNGGGNQQGRPENG